MDEYDIFARALTSEDEPMQPDHSSTESVEALLLSACVYDIARLQRGRHTDGVAMAMALSYLPDLLEITDALVGDAERGLALWDIRDVIGPMLAAFVRRTLIEHGMEPSAASALCDPERIMAGDDARVVQKAALSALESGLKELERSKG